mgnify:FL=1
MKIKKSYPPNIEMIKRYFVSIPNTVVFTYGDTLYNPSRGFVSKDLLAHEKTHTVQQGIDPEGWWIGYLTDDLFRLNEELEAYRNQYKFFKNTCKIKSRIPILLERIAKDLSSNIYGNIIDYDGAIKAIKGRW